MNASNNRLFSFLIVVSMIIWGGSWIAAKEIADVLPPETLTFWRFFITFISLAPVLFLIKEPMQLSRSALFYNLLGSVLTGLYLYLFFVGLKNGLAGAAGVLVTTMIPIMTFVLSIPIFRQRASYKDFSGLALGVMSGGILLEIWKLNGDKLLMSGNIYFLLCIILWASLNICSKKAGDFVSPLVFSIFTYAFCSILFFFLALPQGIMAVFEQGQSFWLNMLYLAIISSGFATTVFFFATTRLGSYRASSFMFLVPLTALIFSWIFLEEVPKISTIAGGLTAIVAVYLINAK